MHRAPTIPDRLWRSPQVEIGRSGLRLFCRAVRCLAAMRLAMAAGIVLLAICGPAVADDGKPPNSAASAASLADTTWLSDMPEEGARVGYGNFGKNGWTGFGAGAIQVNSVRSPHGLGMHPPDAAASYQLDKRFRTFQATVALNDSASGGAASPLRFSVELDGKKAWESRLFKNRGSWQPVLLDVTGASRLTLRVAFEPQYFTTAAYAHAVWLEPCLRTLPPDRELLKLQDPSIYRKAEVAGEYSRRVRELLKADKFAELEQLAKDARAKRDFFDDYPRLSLFYSALYEPFVDSEAGRIEQIDRAADWRAKFPSSVIPRLLAAVNWSSIARSAQSSDSGNESLAKARDLFEEAKSLDDKDAEFYARFIMLLQLQGGSRSEVEGLLDQGIRIDPTYYPLYLNVTAYLLEHENSDSRTEESAFADSVRERIGGETGQIVYAIVALRCAATDGNDDLVRQFPYTDLKPALLAVCRTFPTRNDCVQRTAWLACVNNEPAVARDLFERIPPQACNSQIWESPAVMENARRWSRDDFPRDQAFQTIRLGAANPSRLAVSPDGKSLAAGYSDGSIALIDLSSFAVTKTWRVPESVYRLAFDSGSKRLLVSSSNQGSPGALLLYDVTAADLAPIKLLGHTQSVMDATFTPDGSRVVSGSIDKTSRIWSLDYPNVSMPIRHPQSVWSVAVSPDGSTLCTATYHGEIFLWDIKTGKPIGLPLRGKDRGLEMPWVRFMPDGNRIVVVARDGAFQLWDVKTRTSTSANIGNSAIWCAALAPDGKAVAIGRQNAEIELYDTQHFQRIRTLYGHWGPISDLAFTPDGQTLISAARDTTLKLWGLQANAGPKQSTGKP